MHLCLEERQLRCICYYGDYEEGYDVDFGCPQAMDQQKTITDHSRNVIVILYIVFIEYGHYFKGLYLYPEVSFCTYIL